ncbi:MAG: hypothetical protein Q8K75_08495 [Chlamydiales bacterium]|nr:hypothetical protein [Chlamydiales bacterium]
MPHLATLLAHGSQQHNLSTLEQWIRWSGHLHPALVHYPIALIIFALLAQAIYIWKKDSFYQSAADFMLLSAAFLMIPTLLTGWAFSGRIGGSLTPYLTLHVAFAISATVVLAIALFLRYKGSHIAYLIALIVLAILITLTAFQGGEMVHGPGHMKMPIWT